MTCDADRNTQVTTRAPTSINTSHTFSSAVYGCLLLFDAETFGVLYSNEEFLFQRLLAGVGRQHELVETRVRHRQPSEKTITTHVT